MPAGGQRGWTAPIELLTLVYFLAYVPYVVLTRWMATVPYEPFGRALTGLEILPAATLLGGAFTIAFVWGAGWVRHAHAFQAGGMRWPRPTLLTAVSGVGTALLLVTVPLSFTFPGVSIPYMQLLMRGDVLLIAPLVDLATGRQVRWYSWVALVLVATGLAMTISARGGLHLPIQAIVVVVLYTLGYFLRLWVMTRVAKQGTAAAVRGYFVEEKLVAIPVAMALLAALTLPGLGDRHGELAFGFLGIWHAGQLPSLLALAALQFLVSVFSLLILADRHENSYCVPIERSASVLSGLLGACVLAGMGMGHWPTRPEVTGAGLLVAALVLLSVAPRAARQVRAR